MSKVIGLIASIAIAGTALSACDTAVEDNAAAAQQAAETAVEQSYEELQANEVPESSEDSAYSSTTTESYDESGDPLTAETTDSDLLSETDPADASATDLGASGLGAGAANLLASMDPEQLRGTQVVTADGELVGEIREIRKDDLNQEESVAVVEIGSFLGIGDKEIPLPLSSLQLTSAGQIETTMDRAALEAAANAPSMDDSGNLDAGQEESE